MKVTFTVLGEPQGKGRPRFSRIGNHTIARTPEKTVLYENLIKTEYQRQCGQIRFLDNSPLRMVINAYYSIPASASKKKQEQMAAHDIRPTKKPDCDNIFKVVADSLNQIAYHDDVQIVEAKVNKYYSRTPYVEIIISNLEA